MKHLFIIILAINTTMLCPTFAQNLDSIKTAKIQTLIYLFGNREIEEISNIVKYPLKREYPIPPITNREEFKKRFDQIFDQEIINIISQSKTEQWTSMGYRGIMLDRGTLWLDLEGNIIALNYESDFEQQQLKSIIEQDKANLYPSLKDFKLPIYKIETKNYLLRIDQLDDNTYRYASWGKGKNESQKPNLILYNGKMEIQGSGGNHTFTFVSGRYKYMIYRNIIGIDKTPEINLIVKKNTRIILNEDGCILY